MLVGVLTKSTTLLKMRLQMSESYATWQNLFELICDCVLKELINECFLIFGGNKTLPIWLPCTNKRCILSFIFGCLTVA
jgi:hypothetical protein